MFVRTWLSVSLAIAAVSATSSNTEIRRRPPDSLPEHGLALSARSTTTPRSPAQTHQPPTIAAVADRAGISRSAIYHNPELRAIIKHHQQAAPDDTITAITDELATLRQAFQTLADTVRHHDTQLRRLTRD